MSFSIALPTTPMPTAASTASGKTQKTSMFLTKLAFRRSDQDPPRSKFYLGDVFHRKGEIEILPVPLLTDHENLVGGGLERIRHRPHDLACIVNGPQAYQVGHVELSRFEHIQLFAVEQEHFATQGLRIGPALDAIEVEQEALRGLPGGRDTASHACEHWLRAFPQVPTCAEGAHSQRAAHPVRCDHNPDRDRIGELFHGP